MARSDCVTISYVRRRFAKEAKKKKGKVPDRLIYELLPGPSLTERPDLSLKLLPPVQTRQPGTIWNGSADTETMCAAPGAPFFFVSLFFPTHHQAAVPRAACTDLAVACLELEFPSAALIYPDLRLKCEGQGAGPIVSSSNRCDSLWKQPTSPLHLLNSSPSRLSPRSTRSKRPLQIAVGSATLSQCKIKTCSSNSLLVLSDCYSGKKILSVLSDSNRQIRRNETKLDPNTCEFLSDCTLVR